MSTIRHSERGQKVTKRVASESLCFQVPLAKVRAFWLEHGYGNVSDAGREPKEFDTES